LWLHSLKVAQLLRSAACLHTNQSRSYLNHLVITNNIIKLLRPHLSSQRPVMIKSTVFYIIKYRIIKDSDTRIHRPICIFFDMYSFVRVTGIVS